MTVLVTGARGFLGKHVVQRLTQRGVQVLATDLEGGSLTVDVPRIKEAQLDICGAQASFDLMREHAIRAVVNCAAYGVDYRQQDPVRALEVNAIGTANLFTTADRLGIAPFVHVGTGAEYGSHEGPISEEAALRPTTIYGATKAAGTLTLLALATRARYAPIIVRPFGMYGEGEGSHKLVPQIVAAALSGEPLMLTSGHELRDYRYVGDVADCIAYLVMQAADAAPLGQVFNLGSGKGVTVRDFAKAVATILDRPVVLRFGAIPSRQDVPASLVSDQRKWRGFCARHHCQELTAVTAVTSVVGRIRETACES